MKILIVDDHAYNRELLAFILEDEGHSCIEASNGQEACDRCAEDGDIQLVLMDVNMPVMDGIEATRIIKANAKGDYLTVIFVTALDNAEVLVECLDAGGDDFVPKPINENILISKLKAHARNQTLYNKLKETNGELEYHKRIMDREHRIVEHIFNNDVTLGDTRCENVHTYTSPASLFNGDLLLTAPAPTGGVYVLLGDFTGHGLAAAVGSLPVSSIFYDYASRQKSISSMVKTINSRLIKLLPHGMFFCATVIYLEPNGQQLQLWAGGMNDVIGIEPGAKKLVKYESQHMPLGILEGDEFDERLELLQLPLGTRLYVFTDGINEAKNCEGEELGFEVIDQIVLAQGDVINDLVAKVREFTEGCEQADDVSVLEVICQPVVHRMCKTQAIADVGADYRNAESFPWQLSMHLKASDLRTRDLVDQIVKFLGTIHGIELHQDKIFTIISELYSNALEHGVLRLSSSLKATPDGFDEYYRLRQMRLAELKTDWIDINMAYLRGNPSQGLANKLQIIVRDSGDGFDTTEINLQQDLNGDSHGRGLSLLATFCESLNYSDNGCTVTAVYAFT